MSDVANRTFALRPDVVGTVIEDGAVLLDLESNYFYEVNGPGWAILQLFEAGTTCERVLAQCAQWGASEPDAETVSRFLDTLVRENLVVASDSGASTTEGALAAPWSAPTIQKAPEALQRIMKSAFDPTLPLAE